MAKPQIVLVRDAKVVAAKALADKLDREGAWQWTDGSEHEPSDRFGIMTVRRLGSSRLFAMVYRGTEPDEVTLFETIGKARDRMKELTENR